MKAILIQGARIIDSSQSLDRVSNLLISKGKIISISDEIASTHPEVETIDAKGLVVAPGFIDFHCHLRDPGFEHKETLATGTLAAACGGFTTVCCMPNTQPPIDSRSVVDYVKSKTIEEGSVRVLPIGCITRGRKGLELADMGELASAGVVGFSDDGSPVMNSKLMRHALEYSRTFGLPVIDHCEDTILTEGGQMNEGSMSGKLGLRGMPRAAEESIIARDIALAELTGAWIHIAHISTEGGVELVRRGKEKGIKITAEVTPHHLTLTEEMVSGYNTNAKVNPPLRTRKDTQALIKGLNENVIDVIATDHAPHAEVEKQVEFGYAPFGISVLETAFGSLMSLVHAGEIDIVTLISKLTYEPAKIIGNKAGKLGTLEAGAPADIVLLDLDKDWKVNPDEFASKGRNTPLSGANLKGKVMATVYQGKIAYLDKTIKVKS